jgi:hypothetical protein
MNMSPDFFLVCKTYKGDLRRVERLLASIQKHNAEQITVVLVVPEQDLGLFKSSLKNFNGLWLTDEQVVRAHPRYDTNDLLTRYTKMPGNISQQIIKSEVWRVLQCSAYLCIDSDTVFTSAFSHRDFLLPDGTPYTVMHQSKDMYQLAINRGQRKSYDAFVQLSGAIQSYFERIGPLYDFLPQPLNWSSKVWEDLDAQWLAPKGMTLWDAIDLYPSEAHWYGEALLHFKSIPLIPIEPLCRVYHFDWQYDLYKQWGESVERLSPQYLGVCLQSNWEVSMDSLGTRSVGSKIVRRLKRWLKSKFGNYLN